MNRAARECRICSGSMHYFTTQDHRRLSALPPSRARQRVLTGLFEQDDKTGLWSCVVLNDYKDASLK